MTTSAPHAVTGDQGRVVARASAAAFGATERPRVSRFRDEDERRHVDLLICDGSPDDGLTSYSTVTLHETTNLVDGRDVRVEIAAVAPTEFPAFAHVLATAAFNVIKDAWLLAPDVVFPEALADLGTPTSLRHLMFTAPFPFEDLGSVTVADDLTMHWLLAVPISEAERIYALEHGADGLNKLFEERNVVYYDPARTSIV